MHENRANIKKHHILTLLFPQKRFNKIFSSVCTHPNGSVLLKSWLAFAGPLILLFQTLQSDIAPQALKFNEIRGTLMYLNYFLRVATDGGKSACDCDEGGRWSSWPVPPPASSREESSLMGVTRSKVRSERRSSTDRHTVRSGVSKDEKIAQIGIFHVWCTWISLCLMTLR
jgi:hypothetical protein